MSNCNYANQIEEKVPQILKFWEQMQPTTTAALKENIKIRAIKFAKDVIIVPAETFFMRETLSIFSNLYIRGEKSLFYYVEKTISV